MQVGLPRRVLFFEGSGGTHQRKHVQCIWHRLLCIIAQNISCLCIACICHKHQGSHMLPYHVGACAC